MLVADSHFVMGASHEVCEDYARAAASGKYAYAIVSDGCSSSEDTDIGARLLTLAAESWIKAHPGVAPGEGFRDPMEYAIPVVIPDVSRIITAAAQYASMIDVPQAALDATLLAVVVNDISARVTLHGDGYICAKRLDGGHDYYAITFPDNYPCYISYRLDDGRAREFAAHSNGWGYQTKHVDRCGNVREDEGDTLGPFRPTVQLFARDRYECVAVFSDGVASFTADGAPVDPYEVVLELMKLKIPKGRFVVRRLKKFLKDAAKRGWTHSDDVSMAAVWMA